MDLGTQVPHGAVRGYVMGERGARERARHARGHRGHGRHRAGGHRGRAPSASRPAARSPTAPSTASRCPARSPPRTSCSASAGCSASSAPACSSWRPPARSARTWPRPSGRWTGCAGCPRPSAGPVTFALSQNNADPTSWKRLLDLSAGRPRRRACRCARRCTAAPCRCSSGSRRSTRCSSPPRGAPPGSACCPWQRAGGPHQRRPRAAGAARRRRRRSCATTRSSPGSCTRAGIFVLGDPPRVRARVRSGAPRAIAAARGVDEWELLLELLLAGRRPRAPQRAGPQLHRRHARRRAARCCATRPPPSGSATAAPTPARRATPRPRRSCSRTGPATATTDRLTVEEAVHKMTQATATLYGLGDRGVLAPGFVGDANVIDHDAPAAAPPRAGGRPARAAPAGSSSGPTATPARSSEGQVTFEGGEDTGARPGRLLRGAR